MADKTLGDPIADQAMFKRLYEQIHSRLLKSVTGMVRDRVRAEDVAAKAFQVAWEKRAQFRGESSLGTWLHAIAFNTARHSWRQSRTSRQDSIERLETARYAEPDRLSTALEQEELRARIWEALHRIPAQSRHVLIDHYIDDRSVQEIARRQGVPIGTVNSRLFAARQLLRLTWPATGVRMRGRDVQDPRAQRIAEEALKRLAEELQAGRSAALKDYLAAIGRFHRYSWNNILLIQAQRPGATRVAGYHTWHELGRSVRRGEKGIMILAPVRIKEREPSPKAERDTQSEASRPAGFRTAYVFDLEQTEGRPLPQFATTAGDPKEHLDNLKALVARQNVTLDYDASIAPAQGVSSGGRIRLVPGMSGAEEFSVLTHELAHEMLHHGKREVSLPQSVRETQAEAVAFVVSRGIGLDTNTAAADYIALYNGDKKMLAESLSAIQEAASRILRDLLPDERPRSVPETPFDIHARQSWAPPTPEASPRPIASLPIPEPGDSASRDR
jgi:RNA polymerase sigma factor (sigma-70 family)